MNDKSYNIFSELQANIDDFDTQGIYLVGKPSSSDKYAKEKGLRGGYYYSQRDLNETIDLAINSKYKKGIIDSEGKRKTYINIVNFYANVALMKVDVNASNYILEPTEQAYTWPIFFMDKSFKEWSDENSYDDMLDELAYEYTHKGSCVTKRVKGSIERVPLRSLRNTQTAKSLLHAAKSGGYVIIEDEYHYNDMAEYPAWDLEGLKKNKTYCTYERYSLIPRAILLQFKNPDYKGTKKDWETEVMAVQILIPNAATTNDKTYSGQIAFVEELDEDSFPLEEAHYEKIDGRWQGRGEIEKQLENQIARNLTVNLRRKALSWAARKLFQSTDDEVQKNLLIQAKDGDVLKVRPDGEITQINTQNQHGADFTADANEWGENSKQISFSFEVATGESMPSGTPFRLGVILEKAVAGYFKKKQDTFSNFLKRSFFDQIIPIFKKEIGEHTLRYSVTEDNIDMLKDSIVTVKANYLVKESFKRLTPINFDQAKAIVEEDLLKHPYLFIEIPAEFFDEPQCYMRLNINDDITADIETLTTLYTSMVQRGDPRAEKVLRQILSKKGQNFDYIAGKAPVVSPLQPDAQGKLPPNTAPVTPSNAL